MILDASLTDATGVVLSRLYVRLESWQCPIPTLFIFLAAWLRGEVGLDIIPAIANFLSPRLEIRFDLSGDELQIYRPDGTKFFSYVEICQLLEQAEAALAAEKRRSQILAERLRSMGVNPEDLM